MGRDKRAKKDNPEKSTEEAREHRVFCVMRAREVGLGGGTIWSNWHRQASESTLAEEALTVDCTGGFLMEWESESTVQPAMSLGGTWSEPLIKTEWEWNEKRTHWAQDSGKKGTQRQGPIRNVSTQLAWLKFLKPDWVGGQVLGRQFCDHGNKCTAFMENTSWNRTYNSALFKAVVQWLSNHFFYKKKKK